ncbi:hypothetical protein [Geosporobacter ferrireducens]|uniref:Uncharacterized protein n=1 Tax=Geosporobacter ferrireducens TaxID=1424294 RepID=A0A1D8GGB7_9FIRM|nr:hypothetical protein [Geosporobacter ferrireducens]AOT69927.1 hypothetical protein Gferi_10235 [Geosporobacter ferrireducens]MTI54377.1 hypothetical protein [Geosporobacter ferrireducens]
MYNIIATFKSMPDLKRCMKDLRVNPNIKGHMLVIPKNSSQHVEKEISSVLIKRSREIAPTGLEDIRTGVFTGFIIGGLSAFSAVYFNTNLLNLSTVTTLAALAIIFYGAASGALLGFLTHTIIKKHSWFKTKEEAVLILQKLDDNTKELVIKNLETNRASKVDIY